MLDHETVTIVGGYGSAAPAAPPDARASPKASDALATRNALIETTCGGGKPGRVGGLLVPPQKTRHVNSFYPDDLVRARLGGDITLVGSITPAGGIANLQHVGAGHGALVQALAAAVSQWQFLPAMLNCEPIAVEITVMGRFVPQP